MKHIYLLLLSTFLVFKAFGQPVFITDTSNYKYFIATTALNSNWNKLNFDDSTWKKGKASIGFGYTNSKNENLDSIKIQAFSNGSLLLRFPFTIEDKNKFNDFVLFSDFDDGFIAYINGVEVARVNAGKKGETSVYNKLSDKSKKSDFFTGFDGPNPGLALDTALLRKTLVIGNNILAVQVLNDSATDSQLTYQAWLYNITDENYNYYDYSSRFYQQVEPESSKFPIVEINTDEKGLHTRHVRYMANMKIINNASKINHPGDTPTDYDGLVYIERRGKSSSDFPKFSFNIETVDKDTNAVDTAIMGMPSDNDWVLQANFTDKSILRNEINLEIGRRMGHYEPRSQYCEVFLNGEYQGLYLFLEKIKRGKNRVYVAKKPQVGGTPEESGYVFKFDKDDNSVPQFIYPSEDNITIAQRDYIKGLFKDLYAVLKTTKFNDPDEGYKKYIDPSSLIDYMVINELNKNADGYLFSTYLYKEGMGSKIKYGPTWDNDLSFGNTMFQQGNYTNGWQFQYNKDLRIHLIINDPEFSEAFNTRWYELRKSFLKTENLFAMIDSISSEIEESRIKNYTVWHTIDKSLFFPGYTVNTYEDEIAYLKDYIQKRAKWIDDNIAKLKVNVQSTQNSNFASELFPNPCYDRLNLRMKLEDNGFYTLQIRDMNGRMMYQLSEEGYQDEIKNINFDPGVITKLNNGIYFINIIKDGQILAREKFIKIVK